MSTKAISALILTLVALVAWNDGRAQVATTPQRFRVVDGRLREAGAGDAATAVAAADSLDRAADGARQLARDFMVRSDSLAVEDAAVSDSLKREAETLMSRSDSMVVAAQQVRVAAARGVAAPAHGAAATATAPKDTLADLSARRIRRLEREMKLADSTFTRYSPIFFDTMPISRMAAISLAMPGFGQLHNKQYWKIPAIYAAGAATVYFGMQEQKTYRGYKREYDRLILEGRSKDRDVMDPVQRNMINSNTRRQLWFAGIAATYFYAVSDGVINYPGSTSRIKKATTLSTVLPGAGQLYNGSYWKAPIVMGLFASMAYMIDWNNRGYQRIQTALDIRNNNSDDYKHNNSDNPTPGKVTDELSGYTTQALVNYRRMYRRNRDLCIILTGAAYLLNIIDAHVDAHMKDFDVSDDLSMTLEPSMTTLYTMQSGRVNLPGFSFNVRF